MGQRWRKLRGKSVFWFEQGEVSAESESDELVYLIEGL